MTPRYTGPTAPGASKLRAQCESYLDEFRRIKKRQRKHKGLRTSGKGLRTED